VSPAQPSAAESARAGRAAREARGRVAHASGQRSSAVTRSCGRRGQRVG
jgi:hypothetical protein